jgi:disulfide bond formation protein DsbB
MLTRFIHHPRALGVGLLAASAAPLGLALLSQYGFGLHPCELCIWQRYPYGALIAVALLALAWPRFIKQALITSLLLWATEAALAAYHVGVEQGWWASASGCSANAASASLEALKAQIMGAPLVACDQPELVVLGLSMAGWNVLYSALMMLSLIYVLKSHSSGRPSAA